MNGRPLQGSPTAEQLYETAPCGLLVADAQGKLLRVNDTLCRWLRYPPVELLSGMRFQDLLTMGGRIFLQTHLHPLLRMQGSVAEVKLEMRRRDGTSMPAMVNLAEHFHEGALLLHAAILPAEDRHKYEQELLAQRRRAEELLRQHERDQQALAAAQAAAEDRALFAEQMVGIVSHDLRNPLSTIHMSAALLSMGSLTDQQRSVVARMDRAVQRSERLLNDLLDFTQARIGGGIGVVPTEVDLHRAVADAVAELRTAFPEQNIVHAADGAGEWRADAHRVVQALGNLVRNAVTYGAPGRPITVRTRGAGDGFIVSVHNEGAPIPPDQSARLFEAMVRGERAAGSQGVGLGLYIVNGIARAHGGSAAVHSTAAGGTTFTIRLPAPAARTGAEPPSPAA